MKKAMLFIALAALALSACAAPESEDVDPQSVAEDKAEATIVETDDLAAIYKEYVEAPLFSNMLFASWNDPVELEPDCFVDYYAALQARNSSQPPDGYPAWELEALILQRFHIPVEHIRASTMYKEDTDSYLCEGIGGGADTIVAAVEQNGDILSISYEVYDPDDSDSLLWGGTLFIQLGSDGSYQYLEHQLTAGGIANTVEPEVTKLYQYYSDPFGTALYAFSVDGELEKEIHLDMLPHNTPYFCSSNQTIYYCDSMGIHARNPLQDTDSVILEGEYSELKVMGDRLYYLKGARMSDGSLYTCALDGSEPFPLFADEGMMYGKDSIAQNVSYLIDGETIYYVAMGSDALAGEIRCFDTVEKTSRDVVSIDANVEIIGVCNSELFYSYRDPQTNVHTLCSWNLDGQHETVAASEMNSAIIYGGVVYYSTDSGIYRYQAGESELLSNQPAAKIYAFNHVLYFSFAQEPFSALNLLTNSISTMPEQFEYSLIPISYDTKTATNISQGY